MLNRSTIKRMDKNRVDIELKLFSDLIEIVERKNRFVRLTEKTKLKTKTQNLAQHAIFDSGFFSIYTINIKE